MTVPQPIDRMLPQGAACLAHEILVLDAFLEEPLDPDCRDRATHAFIDDLLAALSMDPLAPVSIFAAADPREPGWSFIQPITTSHVSAHYFENPQGRPHIRIDAYSCASIDRMALIGVCHDHFRLAEWRASFIDRQIDAAQARQIVELAGQGADITGEAVLDAPVVHIHGDMR